jgi:hypothetical protein
MQNYGTATNVDGAEFPKTGVSPEGSETVGPSETTGLTGAGPNAAGGAEEQSMDPWAVAPATTSKTPVPAASSSNSMTSASQSSVAKQVMKVKCIEEPVRTGKNNLSSWKPPFDVAPGSEGSLREIIQRAEFVRSPSQATPVPTGSARFGTTAELFGRLQEAIAEQAFLPEYTSALLTYWAVSTWFADALSLTPGLVIVASEFEGDLVLRTLRNFCRYPLMLAGADISSLQRVNWSTTPTLLFYGPNVTKHMATILGCATSRG